MASATEIIPSRVGSETGIDGVTNATTTWAVIIDDENDDPVVVLRGLRVVPGSPFPWVDDAVVAVNFIRAERPSRKLWHVVVQYASRAFAPGLNTDWTIDLDSGLETEHVDFDVNGIPIGQPRYMRAQQYDDYKAAEDAAGQSYGHIANYETAANYRSMDREIAVHLHRTTGTVIPQRANPSQPPNPSSITIEHFSIKGADRTRATATLTLSRTFPSLLIGAYGSALSFVNKLNDDLFFGAPKHSLKLIAAPIRRAKGTVPGQARRRESDDGLLYEVSLAFLWNPEGHMINRTYHMFSGEDGQEHPITSVLAGETGVAQHTSNEMYGESNFVLLLDSFGSGGRLP